MSNHTEGPWAFVEGDRERRSMSSIFKASDKEFLIGYVICDSRNELARADDVANARLIAAAPELLSALERLSAMCEYLKTHGALREPNYSADCPYEPTCEGMILQRARLAIAVAKEGK